MRPTLVMRDVRDEDGTMWRAVTLTADGGLTIIGHDMGPGVEHFFGFSEYEFERRLSAHDASILRDLLAVPAEGDLLAAIGARFESSHQLENFVEAHGISGEFWSRIGN